MQKRRRRSLLARLTTLGLFAVALVYGVAAITAPWAFHIGGRPTPLLYWSGAGQLVTSNGTYPFFAYFFPSGAYSRLRLDGLRPTGGVRGGGLLCTAPGVLERLDLSGTIYNGWRTTDGSLFGFRFHEANIFHVSTVHGFFDLYGRFQDSELVMNSRGEYAAPFRSGLKLEHAAVNLKWTSDLDFRRACASGAPAHQQP
jgi:hypothetical protein